jgi:hypothetical protein
MYQDINYFPLILLTHRKVNRIHQMIHFIVFLLNPVIIGVRRGVSKGVEDNRRTPALRASHP